MALQECGLNLNRGLKELQPHGTLAFPCAGYSALYTHSPEDIIPWHWHEEIEIVYVKEGCLELKVPSASFFVRKGDILAINSNILHYGIAADNCLLQSLVFSPDLVCGNANSVFAVKYIQPLTGCCSFTGYSILQSENQEMIQCFCRAFDAMEKEPPGFEFMVRENLSHILFFLVQSFHSQLNIPDSIQNQDNLRMKKMLTYIHKNYAEEISLQDIARTADIGERECLRCFQKTIQSSPVQYLLKYRIMQGAEQLLHNPESSISQISLSCGFDSPSNFAKLFKRFYNCTPREYRKAKTAGEPSIAVTQSAAP